ncbi:MAG: dTDP-4-dehydrorhamnose reductase [Cellulophaga sp.]
MLKVLVTGANGQLGKSIRAIAKSASSPIHFIYKSSTELNIINANKLLDDFKSEQYSYCINCAGYTNVDKAEEYALDAISVNATGVRNLALACKSINAILIQISTDFVFDGRKSSPYTEEDEAKSIGSYSESKLRGEKEVMDAMEEYFIIRTSWLYSEYGNNFMKSMLKYGQERDSLSVVFDQVGTPTYAKDLALAILKIIETANNSFGIYHYSNEGVASWYDFARAIFDIRNMNVELHAIRSSEYPTPAKRPSYSVLDKTKIKKTLQMEIPYWRDSLAEALPSFAKLEKSKQMVE